MASEEPLERTLEECALCWHANVRACREIVARRRRETHQSVRGLFYDNNNDDDDTQQGVCRIGGLLSCQCPVSL